MALSAAKTPNFEESLSLPLGYSLNGVDKLMLALDSLFVRNSQRKNLCTLNLVLESKISKGDLLEILSGSNVYQKLKSYRLKRNWFARPQWISRATPDNNIDVDEIHCLGEASIASIISKLDIDLAEESPFRVLLLQRQDTSRSSLIFVWHHALADARAGEELIHSISLGKKASAQLKAPKQKVSFLECLSKARAAKHQIFESARMPLLTFKEAVDAERVQYRLISIKEMDFDKLQEAYSRFNSELFKSSFHLAATARAMLKTFYPTYEGDPAFHIPVPHDLRRKHSVTLGNRLTMLFYKLRASHLNTLKSAYEAVLSQAEDQIRNCMHSNTSSFFELAAFLPDSIIRKLVLGPTNGAFASFFFSDTGNSLSKFEKFGSHEIYEACHYPPHFMPPGFSVVFSKFKSEQKIMIISSEKHKEKLALFETNLRSELLSTEHL